jgi:hypothetical protein|tara:strand:- start:452 stop:745 length:294 start_codon:yes stop_codon:yes gene_type:complete
VLVITTEPSVTASLRKVFEKPIVIVATTINNSNLIRKVDLSLGELLVIDRIIAPKTIIAMDNHCNIVSFSPMKKNAIKPVNTAFICTRGKIREASYL